MEVGVPIREFHFDRAITTPFKSAPSSPKKFEYCYHYTAVASPIAAAARISPPPKNKGHFAAADDDADDGFAFDFSSHFGKIAMPELSTADELFEKGKLLPLKFPLRLSSPAASSQIIEKNSDPFSASMAEAGREGRGRNRTPSISSSRSRKGSRSLSPMRNAGESDRFQAPLNGNTSSSCKGVSGDGGSSRKWSLKDLLLFRSASEGRATGNRFKDPLRKLTTACSMPRVKKGDAVDEARCSTFRLVEGGSTDRKESARRTASPHVVHYTTSRAAAEEMKKRTALPYKEGFFGFLRFAPGHSSFKKK